MQPTFMPYGGFFALINYVDEFILLDNIQFNKRSWQQRNYIKNNQEKELITIPVLSKKKFDQKILEVKIDYNHFKVSKLLNKIKFSYSKSKYFDFYFPDLEIIFNKNHKTLVQLNSDLIHKICEFLKINTNIILASNLIDNTKLQKIDLLVEILKIRKCDEYISTLGAKDYLKSLKKFPDSEIVIKYFEYEEGNYIQSGNRFISNLSILDLLFNEGPNSVIVLKNFFKLL